MGNGSFCRALNLTKIAMPRDIDRGEALGLPREPPFLPQPLCNVKDHSHPRWPRPHFPRTP